MMTTNQVAASAQSKEEPVFNAASVVSTSTDPATVEVPPETWNVFIGDLAPETTDEDLTAAFSSCGPIQTVNIIRNKGDKVCKGFAFIHFLSEEAQKKALTPEYQSVLVRGRPIKVKPSEHKNTLFIGNLSSEINEDQLRSCLQVLCGTIVNDMEVTLKTGPPPACKSRGFCFVKFPNYQLAEAAKKILNKATIMDHPLNVSWADGEGQPFDQEALAKVTTIYVSNLSANTTEEELKTLFSPFGEVKKSVIVKNPHTGESRGYSFLEFVERESCIKALSLDTYEFNGQKLSVHMAKPPSTHGKRPRRGQRTPFRGRGRSHSGPYRGGPPVAFGWNNPQIGGWNPGWFQQEWQPPNYGNY